VYRFQAAHGNDWKSFGDLYFKNYRSVKDAWRRHKLAKEMKGLVFLLFSLSLNDISVQTFSEVNRQVPASIFLKQIKTPVGA
jgi:hypothetical protein